MLQNHTCRQNSHTGDGTRGIESTAPQMWGCELGHNCPQEKLAYYWPRLKGDGHCYMWTTVSQCPGDTIFWHPSKLGKKKTGKTYRSRSWNTLCLVYNMLTTLLSSFKWWRCTKQEIITACEGNSPPPKIICYPVNPPHRESTIVVD